MMTLTKKPPSYADSTDQRQAQAIMLQPSKHAVEETPGHLDEGQPHMIGHTYDVLRVEAVELEGAHT